MTEATASMIYDHNYFQSYYEDWLSHRAKWRPYMLKVSIVAMVFGIVLLLNRNTIGFGGFIIIMSAYHIYEAYTHRTRWIKKRLAGLQPDKIVTISFHSEQMDTVTPNSSSTMNYDAIKQFIGTRNGLFLVFHAGFSIYIPRISIEPLEAFLPLTNHLDKCINQRPEQTTKL